MGLHAYAGASLPPALTPARPRVEIIAVPPEIFFLMRFIPRGHFISLSYIPQEK